MPRNPRRARYRSESELGTWVLGAFVFLLVAIAIAGLVYLWFVARDRPELDATTLCPSDGGPRSTTVVLLDTTDPWPEVVRDSVRKELEEIVGRVPEYGLLQLRLLDPAAAGGRVLFSKCNPGDGSNLSEITANPAMARKQWEEQFIVPIVRALESAQQQPEAPASPILDTIQRLAINQFRGDNPKKLVVVSDMIEHTPEYSQYRGQDFTYDSYKQSPGFKRQRTRLQSAHVTILYIERMQNSRKHLQFWANWVQASGGIWDDAIKIDGAQ